MKLKFFELRSLKTRVTLLTLFLFVISIWSVAFYASRVLREDMQLVLGEQQFSTVTGIANEIDGHLSNRMQALETIAKEVTPKNLGNTAALQAFLEQRRLLQLLFNGGVFITGTDGIAIADVPVSAGRIGINYLDRKSISVPLKEGKTVIGRPAMGKKLGTPIFSITAPIFDGKAQVIGVIVGTINLDKPNFLDQITQTRYGKTGGYLLFAPQHQLIVTASDKTRVMQPAPAPGVNTMYDRYTKGYEGFGTAVSSRGVLELSAAKGISAAGWLIVAVLPTKEAFVPIDRMLQRLFVSTAAATVLAGVLAWWLTTLLLRKQLAPMLEASRTIAIQTNSDQPAQHLPVVRQDEIGELIGDFNRLLGTLKQRENALQKSEQDLAITLNSIGDAVIATDPTGRVTRMNPAAEHLTGWVQHEATGRPLIDVFHIINASTRKPVADPVQLVMEQGQVVGLANHTVLLAKGGQEYQVADSAAPIRNAADEIVGVVLVFSDVTEKYLAEQSLREAQLFSDKLLDSLPGIFYLYTYPEIELVRWNKQHEILLGYGTDEMKGRLATDWFSPEVKGAVAEAIHGVMEKGSNSIEAPMVAKDGHLVPLFLTGVRLELQGRSFFVGTGTDISERKQAEIELAQSKALFEGIFNSIPDAIVYANKERQVTAINPAFTSIFGFCLDDLAGKQTAFFYESQAEYERQGQLRFNLTAAVQALPYEVNYRRKNGSLFPGETLGTVIKTAAGDVLGYIGVIRDITERKEQQSQLEHIAHFDALTNLPNRVLLADRLQQAMAQTQRRGQHLAVAYLDLDGFKVINDHHGHEAGDQVLISLTQRMKVALREGDTLARLGGDEFVAVLIDLEDTSACLPLVNRLLAAAAQPMQVGELSLQVSASLGVTFYPQAQDIDADQLLRQADQAMYQAKVAGKNRYQIFDAAQDSHLRGHHESLERIRLALENHEFVLHYQPKVNMHSGKVIGAEALIRWQHPEQGLLAPAAFLPVIEDHPLAVAVGEWVIDTALTQIELWRASGLDIPVSVNIGARQLQQSDFVERLQLILARHRSVNPASLELEVLETSALADMAQVSQVIEACAQIGVTFALDDFGTGYSSLTYLKRLRVTVLKIDQSFVRDMLVDPDDLAILQGVIGLAAAFKRDVIAEGVETVAHGTALLQLGCELAQGYGIARPMPAGQMPAWVAAWQPDAAWSELPWLGGVSHSMDE